MGRGVLFPTNPENYKNSFVRSWRRGLIPPPLIVILRVAKDLQNLRG
jgi:hypothetical protein